MGQNSKMAVVPATRAEINEIVSLVNGAYRGEAAQAGWTNETKLLEGQRIDADMLAEMFERGEITILLMRNREDGQLTGCVSLEPAKGVSTWYLSMLTVDPRRQAEGLGRLLLSEAEDYLKAKSVAQVRLTVIWLRETLIEWYERRGYQRTGLSESFPYEDRRFGLSLRDDLHFVVLKKTL
jgi:ribosomal protein S18 acetylase RimI-like enzyme